MWGKRTPAKRGEEDEVGDRMSKLPFGCGGQTHSRTNDGRGCRALVQCGCLERLSEIFLSACGRVGAAALVHLALT